MPLSMKDKSSKKKKGTVIQSTLCESAQPTDDDVHSGELCSEGVLEPSQKDSGWGPWGECSSSSSKTPGVNRIEDIDQDVLHLIFEHFDLEPGSQTAAQTRNDLLSAAQTCKAFAEPALNSLWRVLPSLLPLLLLFPSAEVVNGQYFVDLPLTNWERFEIHARRVRTLYMETTRVVISPTIYILIRDMYGSFLRILPGLKAIYIPDDDTIDLHSVILIALGASPDVVELNNSAISERNFFIPFLTLLASKSPQLRHLVLRGTEDISLDPLNRFTNIQRLEIRLPGTYLYPQTLRRLENLVDLQDLTLDAGASTPSHAIDTRQLTHSPSRSRNFGSLKRMHIIGIPSSISRILDDIKLTNLTTLVIDETLDTTGGQTEIFWIRCFHQVSMCPTIEDIEINQLTHRSRGHEHDCLSTSWFRPFTEFNNVKSLVINGSALSGSDKDFRVMAAAFRKLKKLVVPSAYYSKGRTLACLFHFSQYCLDLCEINICIAFDIVKNLDAIKKLPRTDHQHLLEKLYVNSQFGQVQTGHLVQVAQFLDALFPNLSILGTYDSNPTEALTWTGIQQIRVALQATRINTLHRVKSEMATASTESSN